MLYPKGDVEWGKCNRDISGLSIASHFGQDDKFCHLGNLSDSQKYKQMKTIKHILLIGVTILVLVACKKNEIPAPDNKNIGELSIEFDNIVGNKTLQLNTANYLNASGETFSLSLIQYYVSNLKFTNTQGAEYVVPQDSSYFLILSDDRNSRFAKVNVPEGDYKSVTFTLGVDSIRSTMPVEQRQGVLDPTGGHDGAGMYWGWNSGYIFFKMEGTSPAVTSADNKFRYHIGLYGGYDPTTPTLNNIKTVTLDLSKGGVAEVRKGYRSNIHLLVDLMKAFNGPTNISIAEHPTVMVSDFGSVVANNYQHMFSHDHTENGVRNENEL